MKRRWGPVLVGAVAVVVAGLGAPTAAGAAARHDGLRIMAAQATFADPAACADGECDAVFLTAASGVLGAADSKVRVGGIVLVDVYPSTVTEDGLFPVGPPKVSGCTTDVDVTVDRNLRSAEVATRGRVSLGEFVQLEDGTVYCSTATGHWLDLTSAFTGVGAVSTYASQSQSSRPLGHEVSGAVQTVRLADAQGSFRLDDAQFGPLWPGSALLMGQASRSLVLEHRVSVGAAARAPLKVVRHAESNTFASGYAGDWSVDAMVTVAPDGSGKAYLGLSTMVGDDFCWGDSEPSQIELADDLSTGTVSGTVTVSCGETAVEYGDVHVTAVWTGVGDAWRFSGTGVFRSPDGHGSYRVTGVHRDAALTLVLDGVEVTRGSGFMEAQAFKSAPRTR